MFLLKSIFSLIFYNIPLNILLNTLLYSYILIFSEVVFSTKEFICTFSAHIYYLDDVDVPRTAVL